MQGWAQGVIYGVLKCIESQRLKPSQAHSQCDNALPHSFNMAWRSPTPARAIVLFPYLDFYHAGFICHAVFGAFPRFFRGHLEKKKKKQWKMGPLKPLQLSIF